MIRDARVLRAGFVPREVEHRDAEVNHLSSVLESVIDRLEDAIPRLPAGHVDPAELVETIRVSKPLDAYTHTTRTVAALERADARNVSVYPGQSIKYVVVDDTKSSQDRVALPHEDPKSYDPSYYEAQLIRATESLLSPLGWDRSDIRRTLGGYKTPKLSRFSK